MTAATAMPLLKSCSASAFDFADMLINTETDESGEID
jgi:hypothetical protein